MSHKMWRCLEAAFAALKLSRQHSPAPASGLPLEVHRPTSYGYSLFSILACIGHPFSFIQFSSRTCILASSFLILLFREVLRWSLLPARLPCIYLQVPFV